MRYDLAPAPDPLLFERKKQEMAAAVQDCIISDTTHKHQIVPGKNRSPARSAFAAGKENEHAEEKSPSLTLTTRVGR